MLSEITAPARLSNFNWKGGEKKKTQTKIPQHQIAWAEPGKEGNKFQKKGRNTNTCCVYWWEQHLSKAEHSPPRCQGPTGVWGTNYQTGALINTYQPPAILTLSLFFATLYLLHIILHKGCFSTATRGAEWNLHGPAPPQVFPVLLFLTCTQDTAGIFN